MAALTASSVYRESQGSLTLFVINFASVASGDTYANATLGASDIMAWANSDSAGGCGVQAGATGYTLNPMLTSPCELVVLARL